MRLTVWQSPCLAVCLAGDETRELTLHTPHAQFPAGNHTHACACSVLYTCVYTLVHVYCFTCIDYLFLADLILLIFRFGQLGIGHEKGT